MSNPDLHRYEKELVRHVSGFHRRKALLASFRQSLIPFLEENPSPTYEDLFVRFWASRANGPEYNAVYITSRCTNQERTNCPYSDRLLRRSSYLPERFFIITHQNRQRPHSPCYISCRNRISWSFLY